MFKAIADIESAIGNNATQNESNEAELSDLRQERDELQMQVETQETQLKLLKGKLDRLTAKTKALNRNISRLILSLGSNPSSSVKPRIFFA